MALGVRDETLRALRWTPSCALPIGIHATRCFVRGCSRGLLAETRSGTLVSAIRLAKLTCESTPLCRRALRPENPWFSTKLEALKCAAAFRPQSLSISSETGLRGGHGSRAEHRERRTTQASAGDVA
jgi:hypothetical protein